MIIQCTNCGAPLDVREAVPFVDCTYCGKSNKVASTRTLMAVTPANWQAPAQWTEADRERAAKVAMAGVGIAAATTGISGCVAVLIGVIVLGVLAAVGAGFFLFAATRDSAPAPLAAATRAAATWDGSAPFRCSGTEAVVLQGVTANLPNDVAITVTGNCEVTLVDSNITARVGIDGHANGVIRLRNTVIRATEVGASVSINQDLEIDGGSIESAGVGVEAAGNSEITLLRGRITGSPSVRTSRNAEFSNRGGEVVDR